jgi:hypothetical protein
MNELREACKDRRNETITIDKEDAVKAVEAYDDVCDLLKEERKYIATLIKEEEELRRQLEASAKACKRLEELAREAGRNKEAKWLS